MSRSREKGGAAGRIARNTRGSYGVVMDHAVALGERNVLFTRDMTVAVVREYREQTEANLAAAQDLFERAEQQRGELQRVFEESFDAYAGLLYAPLSRGGRGAQTRR